MEFGLGVGFFTTYFLSAGHKVTVLEIESSAFECLKANISLNIPDDHLNVIIADFHRTKYVPEQSVDVSFVNFVCVGLKDFCNILLETNSEKIIYVFCFLESMVSDLKIISKNYKL